MTIDEPELFAFPDLNAPKPSDHGHAARMSRRAPGDTSDGYGTGMLRLVREKATEEGFTAGHAAGWESAQREWQGRLELAEESVTETQSAAGVLHKALSDLRQADALTVEAAAAQAVELAYRLAEAIVEHDVQRDEAVLDAVHRSCALLAVREGVRIAVNPTQVDLVRSIIGTDGDVAVIGDSGINPGGCIAEAGSARVDARWETALAKVRDQLGLSPLN